MQYAEFPNPPPRGKMRRECRAFCHKLKGQGTEQNVLFFYSLALAAKMRCNAPQKPPKSAPQAAASDVSLSCAFVSHLWVHSWGYG